MWHLIHNFQGMEQIEATDFGKGKWLMRLPYIGGNVRFHGKHVPCPGHPSMPPTALGATDKGQRGAVFLPETLRPAQQGQPPASHREAASSEALSSPVLICKRACPLGFPSTGEFVIN